MPKHFLLWTALLGLLLIPALALADTAPDVTAACRIGASATTGSLSAVTDGDLTTYCTLNKAGGTLEIRADEPVSGVYVQLFYRYSRPVGYDLQAERDGRWTTVASGGDFLVHWHPLAEPADHLRIVSTGEISMDLAELRLFGAGDKPAEVQDWRVAEKCDLMLLTAHPDDEILWFAGLLPTYAGERGLTVQCVLMVPTGGERRLEYLAALWHCGVTAYPEMLELPDNNGGTPEKQYQKWYSRTHVMTKVLAVIRRHRPEVLVTHGEGGEYGHGAHRTAADAAKAAVALAPQASQYPSSAQAYGTWQVKKLYLHEYPENTVLCDWDQPLAAFGGKTGFEVAEEAFAFHASQIRRGWVFTPHGEHDNAAFGLYMTQVGPDTGTGDLMEHIEDLTTNLP